MSDDDVEAVDAICKLLCCDIVVLVAYVLEEELWARIGVCCVCCMETLLFVFLKESMYEFLYIYIAFWDVYCENETILILMDISIMK